MKQLILIFAWMLAYSVSNAQVDKYQSDVIETSGGKLTIHFIGHASLMFEYNGKIIYTDPWGKMADFSKFPKADLILITHQHQDHLDPQAIESLTRPETKLVETNDVFSELKKGEVMKNGDVKTVDGFKIEAVPAYNTTPGREKYHPKGRDNGYVVTFGNKRVYIAGDTEDIPEMAKLKKTDIAFLPMNQPYTMVPEQVYKAAEMFHPHILYPYHYGDTDVSKLEKLMEGDKSIELRIRKLQ